jgi:hypothetical protein
MKKEIELDSNLHLRLPNKLRLKYKKHCEDNGLLLSKRVRFLITKDIEGKIDIKK